MANNIELNRNLGPSRESTREPNSALLAEAQRQYSVCIESASKCTAVDGRRVLTSEHVALKSAIDSHRKTGDYAELRSAIDECARTIELCRDYM